MSDGLAGAVNGGAEKATSAVPALFYDIIARIIPGMAFVIAANWAYFKDKVGSFDLSSFLMLIGMGYLSGLLLTGLSLSLDLAWLAFASLFPRGRELYSPFRVPAHIDEVSKTDTVTANALLKMLAESTACQNMVTGFVCLCLMTKYFGSASDPTILKGIPDEIRYLFLGILILAFAYRAAGVAVRTGNWIPNPIQLPTPISSLPPHVDS